MGKQPLVLSNVRIANDMTINGKTGFLKYDTRNHRTPFRAP